MRRVLSPTSIFGPVDVIAEAHQLPARKVPPPWDTLPVTPARIRWRIRRGEHTVRPWHTPIELSKTLLPRPAFRRIYAPGTRQNRQGKPGLYRFYLSHTWSTTLLHDGHYHLEVEATDLRGNQGRLRQPFTVRTGRLRRAVVSAQEARQALETPVMQVIDAVRETLERTPPELSADINERGIVLAGGGVLLRGFPERLRAETGLPVHLAEEPLTCVALGAGRCLDELETIARSANAAKRSGRRGAGRWPYRQQT